MGLAILDDTGFWAGFRSSRGVFGVVFAPDAGRTLVWARRRRKENDGECKRDATVVLSRLGEPTPLLVEDPIGFFLFVEDGELVIVVRCTCVVARLR